jgi:hypothetical protein
METYETVAFVWLMIGIIAFICSIVLAVMKLKCFEKFSQELYNRHHKPKENKINGFEKKKKEAYKPREKKADKVNKTQNDTVSFATNDIREMKSPIFFDDPKPQKHSGKCDGDCKNCPPHYGYRYGRWYYGHSHSEGCELGGNKCDGGRD